LGGEENERERGREEEEEEVPFMLQRTSRLSLKIG
jgi:hypothetical protein